ncbi:MAG TPA: hypothetical protein EYP55_08725 [Anaerolineae bacterium]|nr:hypothetical protein [Anaerolineae bacterium]
MPCNAVATVRAQIKQGLMEALKREPKALEAIKALIIQLTGQRAELLGGSRTEARFVVGGRSVTINFVTGGVVVSGGWDRARNEVLAQQISQGLSIIAGGLLQQRVKAALQRRGYQITGTTIAPNRAMVLSVEL